MLSNVFSPRYVAVPFALSQDHHLTVGHIAALLLSILTIATVELATSLASGAQI